MKEAARGSRSGQAWRGGDRDGGDREGLLPLLPGPGSYLLIGSVSCS
jgi:hypothetical protein